MGHLEMRSVSSEYLFLNCCVSTQQVSDSINCAGYTKLNLTHRLFDYKPGKSIHEERSRV